MKPYNRRPEVLLIALVATSCGSAAVVGSQPTSGSTSELTSASGGSSTSNECSDEFSGWQDAFAQPGQRIIQIGTLREPEATTFGSAPLDGQSQLIGLANITIERQPIGPKAQESPTSAMGSGDAETIKRVQSALAKGANVYLAVYPYGQTDADIYSAVEISPPGSDNVTYIGPCMDKANRHLDLEAAALGTSRRAAFHRKVKDPGAYAADLASKTAAAPA